MTDIVSLQRHGDIAVLTISNPPVNALSPSVVAQQFGWRAAFLIVGAPGLIQQCVDLSRPRGRVVVVGVCPTEDRVLPQRAMAKEISLQFVMGYGKPDWQRVLALLDAGSVDPAPMVTDTVSLDALPAAFEALRKPTTQIKLLVRPGVNPEPVSDLTQERAGVRG